MNTLSVPCCSINWQPVINAIPCICWGIIALVTLIFLLKFIALPLIANCHERKEKAEAFGQEKFWYFQKELKKDYQKELNDRIQKLENEKKKLSEDLDKEKKDRNKTLRKERLQAEHDFYEKILNTFYKADNLQQIKK